MTIPTIPTIGKTTYDGTLPRAAFWDMDGTLINSEPIWHEAELWFAKQYGGHWTEELGWSVTGTPMSEVAETMIEHGTKLGAEELAQGIIDYVAESEMRHMPWIPGALDVVVALHEAGVPNVLVTASPRKMAESAVAQAPEGAFFAYVCSDDVEKKKPDPAPYLAAAAKLGITDPDEIAQCVALEDSAAGLTSAVTAGATTIALTGYNPTDAAEKGEQFATLENWDGVTPELLGDFVRRRLAGESAR